MAEKKIEDFGKKIGGARKDIFAAKQRGGLELDDISNWTDAERNEYIKKDNVFPKPDYQELLDEGRERLAVYFIKTIRDAIPVKPVPEFASPEEKNEHSELLMQKFRLERIEKGIYVNPDDNELLNGSTENAEELERVREKLASMEQEAVERGQKSYIETVGKVKDAVFQVKNSFDIVGFKINLERAGIIVKSALATEQLDKKFAAALNKSEYSLQNSMEKKQFLYSEDEKMLAKYRIQQYDGTNLRFGDSWAGKECIVAKFPGAKHYYYMKNEDEQRRFMNPENWKKDSYFVTSSARIIEHNFESEDEARQFILERERAVQERKAQSEQAFEKATGRKAAYRPPQLSHVRRKGENYREGKDVDGEQMMQTFGFRGGEFGNWENQNDRQTNLNMSYDAFKDMAKALEIADRDISLGGDLAIAYGARGSGGVNAGAAHYESTANAKNEWCRLPCT